jgi:hypothetical protein
MVRSKNEGVSFWIYCSARRISELPKNFGGSEIDLGFAEKIFFQTESDSPKNFGCSEISLGFL